MPDPQEVVSIRLPSAVVRALEGRAGVDGTRLRAWVRDRLTEIAALNPPASPLPVAAVTVPRDHRKNVVSTRLTDEQLGYVTLHASLCGMWVSSYVRAVVLGVTPRQKHPLTGHFLAHLGRIGNTLNQLMHAANAKAAAAKYSFTPKPTACAWCGWQLPRVQVDLPPNLEELLCETSGLVLDLMRTVKADDDPDRPESTGLSPWGGPSHKGEFQRTKRERRRTPLSPQAEEPS